MEKEEERKKMWKLRSRSDKKREAKERTTDEKAKYKNEKMPENIV